MMVIKANKIIKTLIMVFVSVIVFQSHISAYTPAPKSSYMKFVKDNVVFVMSADHGNDPVYNYNGDVFPSSGLYFTNNPLNPIWEVPFFCYKHDALFVEDLHYMIVKEGPYSSNRMGQLAFIIYKDGKRHAAFYVSDFIKNEENFYYSSAGLYSWVDKYETVGNSLIVTTVHEGQYTVDVINGNIVNNREMTENTENKCFPYLLIVGVLLVVVGVLLLILLMNKTKDIQQR
jgi:hypothetical protein